MHAIYMQYNKCLQKHFYPLMYTYDIKVKPYVHARTNDTSLGMFNTLLSFIP